MEVYEIESVEKSGYKHGGRVYRIVLNINGSSIDIQTKFGEPRPGDLLIKFGTRWKYIRCEQMEVV